MTAQSGTRTIQRTSARSRHLCQHCAMQSRQRFHLAYFVVCSHDPPTGGLFEPPRGGFKEHEAERLGFEKFEV